MSKAFHPGDKVYLVHTGEWAELMSSEDAPYLLVCLPDGTVIEVHEEDVMSYEEHAMQQAITVEEQEPSHAEMENNADEGVFLKVSGIIPGQLADEYLLSLVNTCDKPVDFTVRLFLSDQMSYEESGRLEAGSTCFLFELYREDLSDAPRIRLQFDGALLPGRIEPLEKDIRVRPHQLLQPGGSGRLEGSDWWVPCITPAELATPARDTVDLRPAYRLSSRVRHAPVHELAARASFPDHIDLHAENLFSGTASRRPAEIVQAQLQAFERYLDQAIRYGLDRVYIVHGVGKGALMQHIHDRLHRRVEVVSFENNYQPRFGWGATEVRL